MINITKMNTHYHVIIQYKYDRILLFLQWVTDVINIKSFHNKINCLLQT